MARVNELMNICMCIHASILARMHTYTQTYLLPYAHTYAGPTTCLALQKFCDYLKQTCDKKSTNCLWRLYPS